MKTNKQQKFLDVAFRAMRKQQQWNALENPGKFHSTLFSRGKKSAAFFTEDSKLYITPRQARLERSGIKLDRTIKKWDALSSRIERDFVRYQPRTSGVLQGMLQKRKQMLDQAFAGASESVVGYFSLARLWNLSIVASILFGMVTMTFIYRYLGQGAAADQTPSLQGVQQMVPSEPGKVLGEEVASSEVDAQTFSQQVMAIEKANDKNALEDEIRKMVKGYPIEKMAPYIAEKDPAVAAFIIAIAKKESGWGVHHPVLNGQDCYNYVGYRGQRKLMGTGGHTCFNSPKDAVDTIAKRLNTLIHDQGYDTPQKMVNVWKCGTSCVGDAGAPKWVSDVDGILKKFQD